MRWYIIAVSTSTYINRFRSRFTEIQITSDSVERRTVTQWKPIIKLRTSNHYLPIETGRWNNTERHERECTLCNDKDLGDEYHYIFCV